MSSLTFSVLQKKLCALLVAVVFIFQVSAQDTPLPTDPTVKIGKLSNGITYYIRKNGRPEKKVELRLVVNAGSILEDDDQQGLAHFVEHMAFNGSKHFQKNDLVSFLQSIGVKFGADLNAYTGFDETVYILPIPTDKKENIEKGFLILEDWASTVAFDHTEIDKERGVVLEESRYGKGAEDRMFRVEYPKIFEGSKYAERLTIGKDEILKTFKYDRIEKFYHDWYRPDMMAVVVVGDIDPAEAEKYVKDHFEKIKPVAQPRERTYATIPLRAKSEGLVITDKEATNPVIEVYYSWTKEKEILTQSDYRGLLVRQLFQTMLALRLQELTQKAEPPFIFGSSALASYARGYEVLQCFAYIGKSGIDAAMRALLQENERARRFGFTSAELDRTKKMMMKSMERSYSERDKTESSSFTQEYIDHFLNHEPMPGVENEFNYYKQYLDGITLDEVNKFAATTLPAPSANKLVVLSGPEQVDFKLPTNEELLALADKALTADIKPYEEKAIATSLMERTPTAGTITSEKENKALGTTELVLSNGVKVILKPTDFKNDQVIMNATRFGGQFLFDAHDRFSAEFASTLVRNMGVANFSPVDLRKVLAGKSASVTTQLSQLTETMSASCSATDLEVMFQLAHLYMTQPRKDAELFNGFVSKQSALLQNAASDPEFVFQDTILHTLYNNQPWAPMVPKPENIAKINLDRSYDMYKQRFGDATGFTFVVVGKFDLATIKPLIATYLASLPASGKKSTFKDVGLRPATGVIKKEVKKGTEQKSFIRAYWNGDVAYNDQEALKLQALVEVLNIKLIERLREDMGGMYSGGMFGKFSKYPYGNYSIGMAVPCGPENVDKLIAAALEEIDKIKNDGPSETDLNKVKETWKQQHDVNMKDNAYWTSQLIQSVELGADPAGILSYEKRIAALTPKDIKEAAIKFFNMKNYAQFVLNPEK